MLFVVFFLFVNLKNMYVLKYSGHFDSAHSIKDAYTKKCQNIHGHCWKVNIQISVLEKIGDMIVDFKKLKEVIDFYDHKNLNDIMTAQPTAENIVKSIYNDIARILVKEKQGVKAISVELFETDNASIIYNGEE